MLFRSNNTTNTIITRNVEYNLPNYVVNNVFTITSENVKSLLFDNPIQPFQSTPIKPGEIVTIQFVLIADAVDKVKNPQPTEQSFNFYYNKPNDGTLGQTLAQILENQPGSLVRIGETNSVSLPDYNGPSYYNIKKQIGRAHV